MSNSEFKSKIRLFCSYSHKDDRLRQELEVHLAPLEREELIQSWYDRKIDAGIEWGIEIENNFEAADIILFLVSADFLASDYCYEKEMLRAMEKHQAGEVFVIPVILRDVDWKSAPFSKLQALPKDTKPVTVWSDRDAAWTDVVKGIRKVIEKIKSDREQENSLLQGIKPEEYLKTTLSVKDYENGAKRLCELVGLRRNFDPDVLIAINESGMVTAAAMNILLRKTVGVLHTAVERNTRVVKNISLPYEFKSGRITKLKYRKILVVDAKIKTGDTAQSIQEVLQQAYGPDIDIRYAMVLAYGGWESVRWKITQTTPSIWPIRFRPKGLDVYVAYYTDTSPYVDVIREEVHPNWRS